MPEGQFRGEGMGTYEARGHLSRQERDLLAKEEEVGELYNTQLTVEQLRGKEGPRMIAEKYPDLFKSLIDTHGDAASLSLRECYEFGRQHRLPFEPIVLLASAMEAEQILKQKRALH